jgi:hypothetical protein
MSANHLMANEDRIRESNDFLDKCQEFNHKMKAVMIPFKLMYIG